MWFNDDVLCFTYGNASRPLEGAVPFFSFETENNGPRDGPEDDSVHGFLASVRVGLEGDGIDGPLVLHELVTLVFGKRVQFIVLGIRHDLVDFHRLGLARLALWISDLLQHIVSHDLVIQLGFSLAVQAESLDFTFHFPTTGLVTIILGASRHKFHDVIVDIHLTGEVSEEISEDGVW